MTDPEQTGSERFAVRCPNCRATNDVSAVQQQGVCHDCREGMGVDLDEPEVVCLCGSTRFKDEYRAENRRLTMEGKIVVSVGMFGHSDDVEFTHEEKAMLDELHKRKIDLSDRIHVINVDGYVGDSTQSEIEYARETGTEITYLEQPVAADGGTDSTGTERCKWCGEQLGGIKSSLFDEACDDCGIRQPWERAEERTVAIVGCGKNKIVTAAKVEIQALYTSDYFAEKREYAEEECDRWRILSAKHGLVRPTFRSHTYDCSMGDHDDEQREEWLDSVETSLRFLAKPLDLDSEIVLLAGRDYLDPIRPILETIPRTIRDPFASTSGIGDQRGWLADELAETEQVTLGEVAR